jgi:hypothetical protein
MMRYAPPRAVPVLLHGNLDSALSGSAGRAQTFHMRTLVMASCQPDRAWHDMYCQMAYAKDAPLPKGLYVWVCSRAAESARQG